jgi:DNA-binding response OmpR family regulator
VDLPLLQGVTKGIVLGAASEVVQDVISKNAPRSVSVDVAPRISSRVLTLLLVDSDAAARRQLLGMLAARGHRVIPAPAEQAADLAPRMRFDAAFWAVRSGGPKWSDQQDRIRPAVPAFVLISDGYDRDLAASLEDSGGFLLARPLQAVELDRVLEALEARTNVRTPA